MPIRLRLVAALVAPVFASSVHASNDLDPISCTACAGWNEAVEPYVLAPNTWYVGTRGLASVLIADPAGLVLIDGGLPQSVPHILDNLRKLGFGPRDIRWVLNSHAHFDHAGGIAALARLSGAKVGAGARGVVALETGLYHPDDAQIGFGEAARYPAVAAVVAIQPDEVVRVGALEITAIATPGHAPGGMSWTWRACGDDGRCQQVVYLDSLNAVSAPGYRFVDHPAVLADLRASIERIRGLECDVAMAAHPDQVPASDDAAGSACAQYAEAAARRLDRRLEQERAEVVRAPPAGH